MILSLLGIQAGLLWGMSAASIQTLTLPGGEEVKMRDDIVKSSRDKAQYRHLALPNGLEVLLVSEKGLDKASAALNVHVGHFSDPKETPGLAHFLEHVLFMGTTKYPEENAYSKYLSAHGGRSNAFTSEEHTAFYFDVAAEHLEGALDRFAQFFISPLFNLDSIQRELKAVDAENKKNLRDDAWRSSQLLKTLSSESHPLHGFGTGNAETLKKKGATDSSLRKELIDFYKKHYSANLMRLVVFGGNSIDELQDMVIRRFLAVPNHEFKLEEWPGKPLDERHFGKLVRLRTLKAVRTLSLAWQLEDLSAHQLESPASYISHLVGHESYGSIFSLLKKKGWATSLSATRISSRGYGFFGINVELSADGLHHASEVTKIIFQYLAMIRKMGPQRWIFDENQRMQEINFETMEKGHPSTFATNTAGYMHLYPPALVLKGPRVVLEYNPELIQSVMDQLRTDNFRMAIKTNDALDPAHVQHEKWYGTEYTVEEIDPELMKALAEPGTNTELHLPRLNPFIPQNLESKQPVAIEPVMHPLILVEDKQSKLWHKQDDIFGLPKGCFVVAIKTLLVQSSPLNYAKSYLYVMLLQDALNELLYEMELAGLSLSISIEGNGLVFSFCGYDDKLSLQVEAVMQQAVQFRSDPKRFNVIRERVRLVVGNFIHENPYILASRYMNGLRYSQHLWPWQVRDAFEESITVDEVDELGRNIFARCNIEALCHGNFRASDAEDLLGRLKSFLPNSSPVTPEEASPIPTIQLKPRQDLVFVPHLVPNTNVAIDVFLQIGPTTDVRLRTRTKLFAQIFHEPFFDMIRTKEQLVYVAFHHYQEQRISMGLRFLCQSERDPLHLDGRIEAFLANTLKVLETMAEVEYEKHIAALVSNLLAKKRRLDEETSQYWAQITSGLYDFEQAKEDAAHLPTISKDDLMEFVRQHVLREAPLRRKLSVHLWPERLAEQRRTAYTGLQGVQVFEDGDELKKHVDRFPRVA